jgi:hypothetical protein
MIKKYALTISVVVSSIIAGSISQPAIAASSPNDGLTVSPAINSIQILQGESTDTFNETVTNITDNELAVDVTVKDFGALNQYGSIGFYGSNYNPSSNSHSLSSSITIPSSEFLIGAHASQVIPISMNNINKLSPGGHYSAILFTPIVARSTNIKNQISVQPSVASLIFLTTSSGGVQSLKLSAFSVPRIGFNLPSSVYALITNNGNTQVIPRGVTSLTDPTSRVLAQTVLNSSSGMILPGTSRLFTISLSTANTVFKLPGLYHIKLQYAVAGSSAYKTVNKTFIYINPFFFIYLALIVLIIWLIIRLRKRSKFPLGHRRKSKKAKIKGYFGY